MTEPLRFGKHTVHYEDPDIAVVTCRGPVSIEELRWICSFEPRGEHAAHFSLTICDLREMGELETGARRVAAERAKQPGRSFVAYVGAGFGIKVIISMIEKANTLLFGEKNASGFFDDLAAAKAWLLSRRKACLERDSKPPRK